MGPGGAARILVYEMHRSDALRTPGRDWAVAAAAARQGGAVDRVQLRQAGLGRGAVAVRVRNGLLHPVHRDVFAVGHGALPTHGRLWAAVLACGGPPSAGLSHRTAAWRWDLISAPSGPIDVSSMARVRPIPGLRLHHPRTLRHADLTTDDDGLPLTTVARTLVDIAASFDAHRMERACHQCEHHRLLDVDAIEEILGRGRYPGARNLRLALGTLAGADPQVTWTEIEELFLAIVADAGLPRPLVNEPLLGHIPDFHWPQLKLVVETDGAATHLTATAFQSDRRRDVALQLAGYRVLRFTWRDVVHDPAHVRDALRRAAA